MLSVPKVKTQNLGSMPSPATNRASGSSGRTSGRGAFAVSSRRLSGTSTRFNPGALFADFPGTADTLSAPAAGLHSWSPFSSLPSSSSLAPAPGAPPLIDEGAWPVTPDQQAMNSSPQDHDAAGDSPAPPAISPLTDPADPGNREPSPRVDLNLARDDPDHADPLPNATNLSRPPSRDALTPASQLPPHLGHNHAPDAPMADLPPLPVTSYFSEPLEAFTSPLRDTTYAGWNGRGNVYNPAVFMALANLSNSNLSQMPLSTNRPMTTVHPSLISANGHGNITGLPSSGLPGADPDRSLESFARIEFADSVFQMTTYAVIIGRDQNALNAAKRDKRRADEHQLRVNEARAQGLPDPPAPALGTLNKFSKSYVSNEGGMLGPESDGDGDELDRRQGKRRKRAHSGSGDQPVPDEQDRRAVKRRRRALSDSAGHPVLDEPDVDDTPAQDDPNVISERQYISHTPGAVAVNVAALRPSPYEVPFIGIHSPHPNVIAGTKGISRQHLKIQFSSERGVFEAVPLHKNGFFVGDTFYKDEKVTLRSGDTIQIKDVTFTIVINGVPRGKTGAEEYVEESEPETAEGRASEGPKAMSLAFESSHQDRGSTSVEAEDMPMEDQSGPEPATPLPKPGVPKAHTASDASSPEGDSMDVDQDASGVMETIEDDGDEDADGEAHPGPIKHDVTDLADLLGIPVLPKKRGPGRPPKNGIMSKREERLRRKAAQELAKKNMPQPPPGEPPIKRKVGRPRKHPLPDDAGGDRPEKRKYKPRKKNGEEGGESDAERVYKEKRKEKPKTPPLELIRSHYTDEQMQKPNKNYGVLIDEVLTAALPDGLTLKQIYKRIQIKYPFFYFIVDTKGWESSVRHNLIGNVAFKKNEETHLWCRVPGIDIDAGKKRKAPSPDHAGHMPSFNQQYSNPASYGAAPNYHQSAGAPPAGYPSGPPTGVPGQAPQQLPGTAAGGVPLQPPRQPYPNPGQAPAAAQPPAYQQAAAGRPPQGVSPGPSYSAPYAPANAPVAMAAQPGATPHSMARQYTQSPNGASVPNGTPPVSRTSTTPAAAVAQPVARPPQQPAAPASAPLKPAVAPELVRHVVKFKATARETLTKLSSTPDAIAAAAVHRALGLTTRALEPSDEALAKIIINVFETSRKHLTEKEGVRAELTVLHPDLLQTLLAFKDRIIQTIEKTVGPIKGEQLILSAIDRALGFSDRSNMTGTPDQMNEINRAEDVLIPAISNMVVEHQRRVANAALKAAAPPAGNPPTTYPSTANPAGTSVSNYRPTAPGSAAAAPPRAPPPAPSSSATPAAMYKPSAAPAAAARPPGGFPPQPPVQAANAHVAHAPAAPPAAHRAPQPTPLTNPASSATPIAQLNSAWATSASAKSASVPSTPSVPTSAPSSIPRASASPSVPAAPSVHRPQTSFTPPTAKAAQPVPASSSGPIPPAATAPAPVTASPTTAPPAAPTAAANLPTAVTPSAPMMPAVAPPAPMMPPATSPAVTAPAPAPAPTGPAATAHPLPSPASPPLPRAAPPPATTPSRPTATTAP